MVYLYILKSPKSNRFYIGTTKDYRKRLLKHNSGSVRSTKAHRPWKVVYIENFENISQARKRENQLKSWKNKKKIENLILAPSSNG